VSTFIAKHSRDIEVTRETTALYRHDDVCSYGSSCLYSAWREPSNLLAIKLGGGITEAVVEILLQGCDGFVKIRNKIAEGRAKGLFIVVAEFVSIAMGKRAL
jgi:hypothetical protein